MCNSKDVSPKNQENQESQETFVRSVQEVKSDVLKIAKNMAETHDLEPGKQITVQELYDLAQKISAPTWTGRGNVCQAHHMGEAKRLLKILAEGVPLTKDPQSEYPPIITLAVALSAALGELQGAIQVEKARMRKEAAENNISSCTFREQQDFNFGGMVGHSHPNETLKNFNVQVGFNNDEVVIDKDSRKEGGLYNFTIGGKLYENICLELVLTGTFIRQLFNQFVTSCNVHAFDPVLLVFALLKSASQGFRDDRPYAVKSVTELCKDNSSARNLRDWLTKDSFHRFFKNYASVIIQLVYHESRHLIYQKSNDFFASEIFKMLGDKFGVADFILHDGITNVVNNETGLHYDCKGSGSYQTANKSQGNKRFNSSGRNSHTKDHCAVSLTTKCPVNNTITKGTAGEAMNVDSYALTKLGKICLIMDRGYRSIVHLMLAQFYGHYFIARELTTCNYIIMKVRDLHGNEIPELTEQLQFKSVKSPEAQKAIEEHGILDFTVFASRYVEINTIPDLIDHLIDKARYKKQHRRRACMGRARIIAATRDWKHKDDHRLIIECLSRPELDLDVDYDDTNMNTAPFRNKGDDSKENTETADAAAEVKSKSSSDKIMYLVTNLSRSQASALDVRLLYILRWVIELFAKTEKQNYSLQKTNARHPNTVVNLQIASLILGALNSFEICKAGGFISNEDAAYDIEHLLIHQFAASQGITREYVELNSFLGALKKLSNNETPKNSYNPLAALPKALQEVARQEQQNFKGTVFFRAEDFRALQNSRSKNLGILNLSAYARDLLLRSALHGDAYALEQFSKFDKAMSRLGYKNIQSAMVIREVQEDCQRYDIPIDLAITKPKTPPQISLLQAASLPYMGNLIDECKKVYTSSLKEKPLLEDEIEQIGYLLDDSAKNISESALATHISLRAYEETKDNRLVLAFIIGMAINKVNGDPNDPSDVPKSENSDPPESENSLSLAA